MTRKMKREIVVKALAITATLSFMVLVRTDAEPKLWQVSLVALGLYESIVTGAQIVRIQNRKVRRNKNICMRQQDARRWAEEWFNPLKEVI